MITDNIKNIFSFIEFLNLNIAHFNKQKPLLEEISQIRNKLSYLDPKTNFEHTFIKKELNDEEDKLEERFNKECRIAIREKAIELNVINFEDRFGSGFVNIGDLIILVQTRAYDRDDVKNILCAKDNYISVMTKIEIDLNRILNYGILRDFKDDLFDCFKPFLSDDDKIVLGKFSNFEDFISFCQPQLKNFQLGNDSLENINSFEDRLSRIDSKEQIDLFKKEAEIELAKTKLLIVQFLESENIAMNFKNIKKIESESLLDAVCLYFKFRKLINDIDSYVINLEALKKINFDENLTSASTSIEKQSRNDINYSVENIQELKAENDFTVSTIEDWLYEFKEKMSDADYKILVSSLMTYFKEGSFPNISKPIQINGRINKKQFGWALNRIFEAKAKGVNRELLQFAKQNISLFRDVKFDENDIFKSNLYKYFTTKTK